MTTAGDGLPLPVRCFAVLIIHLSLRTLKMVLPVKTDRHTMVAFPPYLTIDIFHYLQVRAAILVMQRKDREKNLGSFRHGFICFKKCSTNGNIPGVQILCRSIGT